MYPTFYLGGVVDMPLPSGGEKGQLLRKNSASNGDASWACPIPGYVEISTVRVSRAGDHLINITNYSTLPYYFDLTNTHLLIDGNSPWEVTNDAYAYDSGTDTATIEVYRPAGIGSISDALPVEPWTYFHAGLPPGTACPVPDYFLQTGKSDLIPYSTELCHEIYENDTVNTGTIASLNQPVSFFRLAAALTFTSLTPYDSGSKRLVYISQPKTGGTYNYTVTWPGDVVWASGSDGVPGTGAGVCTLFELTYIELLTQWLGREVAAWTT